MNSSLPNGMPAHAPQSGHHLQDQFNNALQNQSMTALLNNSTWPPISRQPYPHQPSNHQWQQHQQQQQTMQNGHHVVSQHPQASAPPTVNTMQHAFPSPAFDLALMQDFYRLQAPVGQSSNDDSILAQALFGSKQSGRTYRQALEGLHGVNNHAANLWKDYYLDHHDRFEIVVARLVEQSQQSKVVKKPFASTTASASEIKSVSPQRERDSRKRQPSPSPPLRRSRQPKRSTPTATTPSLGHRPLKRPRATLNSLSAPLLPTDLPRKLMPLQADIALPPPPSRSPTPPTKVEAGTNGNKYTEEDRTYFLKFISWRLSQDASLTKKDLCAMLNEKVPHHSATSWASHWHNRHDIADKIFRSFQGEESEDDENEDEDEDSGSASSPSEADEEDSESEVIRQTTSSHRRTKPPPRVPNASNRVSSVPSSPPEMYDPSATTDTDEADMGPSGSLFTPADWRILARYVARTPGWDGIVSRERWEGFLEMFPDNERSDKSWKDFYRRNEGAIMALSAHYKGTKWLSNMKSISMQQGNPSWARQRGRRGTEDEGKGSDEDGDYEIDDGDH